MSDDQVRAAELIVGSVVFIAYLVSSLKQGIKLNLSSGLSCFLTGVGIVAGPLLLWGAINPVAAEKNIKPEHFIISGIAILWVNIEGAMPFFKKK
jgi:hypothetical protein